MQLRLSTDIPAIYAKLYDKFSVYFVEDNLLITVGDTCHCADKEIFNKRSDLYVHEWKHMEQQTAMGVGEWWKKFMDDPKFRLKQELEAYKFQWEYLKDTIPDRNKRFPFKKNICDHLSGKMYGGLLSYSEAWRMFN